MSAEKDISKKINEETRTLDPNVSQRRASSPDESVCVSASAGTGKTKVLTDRVLRLLLPRKDGSPGTQAHRILCLTFTKAAASEMLQRINAILGKWAVIDDGELAENIKNLTGDTPDKAQIQAARQLFASVIDTPGGLKVMTIHSFCQSVLGRFPLEAGLPPHFSVIDDAPAQELISRARDHVLIKARTAPDSALGKAVITVAAQQNEEQFGQLLRNLCGERLYLKEKIKNPQDLYEKLCTIFDITPGQTAQKLYAQACEDIDFDKDGLYSACRALASGTPKTDQPKGIAIQEWLDATEQSRLDNLFDYMELFLKKSDGLPFKNQSTGSVQKKDETCELTLQQEALRLYTLGEKLKAIQCAVLTRDLVLIGKEIINEYQSLKEQRGVLDYDDLILETKSLLADTGMAPWVLYKLDGGLDHILVDEAQDTNPEQWDIIGKLCEDFFAGVGARDDIKRTVFTVGDEKQSIYSFQRAAPEQFARKQDYFIETAKAQRVKLDISFRSVQCILDFVDETFRPDHLRQGLGPDILEHHSFRKGQGGLIELWPPCKPDEMPKEEPWSTPTQIIETPSGQARLAEKIGETIERWLENGEIIESTGRAITPGDIMILVRTRTAFVGQLVRALKTRNIAVSGVDRMVLGEQIAVMDLLALAQFTLLPDDDLSLACVLKSPLIGLDEEQLFTLAHKRRGTLWEALQRSDHKNTVNWLQNLVAHGTADHPYEFFSRILQAPCPADPESGGLRAMLKRLGEDAADPLDELLGAALSYERDHIPTLQGFLVWQQQGDMTIKREMEEAGHAVRIMTVHGSKGLQAPIVILPDTMRTSSAKRTPRLLWPDKTGLGVPLWSPRASADTTLYAQARSNTETHLDKEYRRLLYVAMTRAEDRLYIGGYKTKKKEPIEESWYNYAAQAFERLPDTEEDEDGTKRFKGRQTREPERPQTQRGRQNENNISPPDWLFKKAPEEPDPPRPLIPSKPSAPEPAARSPLDKTGEQRFRRGNITHKLLQILPDLPESRRRDAAAHFLTQKGHNISGDVQKSILDETMAILEHPAYAPLFGEGSLAEIPITGLMHGKLISAQIDRLLVRDNAVWIVDYKTNRPPPQDESGIPEIYRNQMRAYRNIIAKIYPDRHIETFLLWTDGPLLMKLENL